jgi:hypothetical protein
MPKPFEGTIKFDIRDSTPDWDAFLPDKAPEGGRFIKVVFDVANDVHVEVERHLAAAMAE